MVVLHGSDLQTGRPYRPEAAAAFVAFARALEPDLVVVSGDLTQRAKRAEFRTARAFLGELAPLPVVVTPGNHDVPLWRVAERLLTPYRKWRRYVSAELDTVTRVGDATVVALNSSAPRRAIVGGRLDPEQLAFAREAFGAAGSRYRILVTHHHFVPTPDGQGGRPIPRAADILRAFEGMGVDLVLGGHVHRSLVTSSRDVVPGEGPGIPLVACGTTASSRGRGPEVGRNALNVVRIGPGWVEVEPHLLDGTGTFVPQGARRVPAPTAARGPAEAPA